MVIIIKVYLISFCVWWKLSFTEYEAIIGGRVRRGDELLRDRFGGNDVDDDDDEKNSIPEKNSFRVACIIIKTTS